MHYYKRHLGDYARDTGHLTALEHGIYTLLLDWYYVNERPIPADKAIRIARGNPEETETVLREFFHLTDDGWRHHRADREIEAYTARSEVNREAGKLGGRPKKTQTVSETEPKRNPDKTLTTNQEPLTKNQEEATTDSLTESVGASRQDDDPVAVIVSEYHDTMTKCQKALAITPARRRKLLAADKMANGVCKRQGWDYAKRRAQFWRAYFDQCQKDPWLRGDMTNPNNPKWKQNLFVLTDDKRFGQIMDDALSALQEAA